MKYSRILLLLCTSALLLCSASCKSNSSTPAESTLPPALQLTAPPTDTGYLDLTCQSTAGISNRLFSFEKDTLAFNVGLPKEWTLEQSEAGVYEILRDNAAIGKLYSGAPDDTLTLRELKIETEESRDLTYTHRILSDPAVTDPQARYFHQYVYSFESNGQPRTVTLTVNYTAADDFTLRKLGLTAYLKPIATETHCNALGLGAAQKGKPILILGNSFIGSSDIGAILSDFCVQNGKQDHEIIARSVGYASVSRGDWDGYLGDMQAGRVAAVFMCGFYNIKDVSALEPFVDACAKSNTPLVIFPAHNEGSGSQAAYQYPELLYLNWKAEINSLIVNGISRSEFCIDDAHQHSTPLAGFVGAHMIYRAVYGEIPRQTSYREYQNRLGDYAQNGCISLIDPAEILPLG